eukprot:TRINITY_DN7149_c0_g1_i2.p1 TRINITY_DN7149_c0_g1~~TRINITY_DN7149_c0_g1_i2.p1  ORF type:complete len:299 (+),score=51.15 TRINITY_DN7149_c0_g1_i2:72-968(+)
MNVPSYINLDIGDTLKLRYNTRKDSLDATIVVSNKTLNNIAFKVRCTNPKLFFVKPNQGILLSKQSEQVLFRLSNTKADVADVKVMIQAIKIDNPRMDQEELVEYLRKALQSPDCQAIRLKVTILSSLLESDERSSAQVGSPMTDDFGLRLTHSIVHEKSVSSLQMKSVAGEPKAFEVEKPMIPLSPGFFDPNDGNGGETIPKEPTVVNRTTLGSTTLDYKQLYDETFAKLSEQEKIMLQIVEERNKLSEQLGHLKDEALSQRSTLSSLGTEQSKKYEFVHLIAAAIAGLLLGLIIAR